MGDILISAINKFLYNLTYIICWLIDTIVGVFKKLAGIESVQSTSGNSTNILSSLFESSGVKTAFWAIMGASIVLLIVITIVGIFKSYAKENPQAEMKEVLTGCFKSIGGFLLINAIMAIVLVAVPVIFNAINAATSDSNGGTITLGGSFIAGECEGIKLRDLELINKGKYTLSEMIGYNVDFSSFNNFLVILVALPTLVSFFYCMVMFVKRLFALIGLYISAPVVLATQPADGGFAVKKWRESLFNQLFSVLGIIVLLNVYLLIVNQLGDLQFFEDAKKNTIIISLMKGAGAVAICAGAAFVEKLFSKDGGEVKATGKSRLSGIFGRGKAGKDGKDAEKSGSMLDRVKGSSAKGKPGSRNTPSPKLLAIMRGGGSKTSSTAGSTQKSMLPGKQGGTTTNRTMISQRAVQARSLGNLKRAESMKQIVQSKKPVQRPKILNLNKVKKE